MKEIVKKMIEFLENAPEGVEYTTLELLNELKVSVEGSHNSIYGSLMALHKELRREARKHKIKFDSSKYENMVVGVPYNIPYVVRKKKVGK